MISCIHFWFSKGPPPYLHLEIYMKHRGKILEMSHIHADSELTLFSKPRFLLDANVLSRKSHFVGSSVFFISPMGIVSFFVSLRCIAGSGKRPIMNQGCIQNGLWVELMGYLIQERESETTGVEERWIQIDDIPLKYCVCIPNSDFIHIHIWIRRTRAVSWIDCWFISFPTGNGSEGFEMGYIYCFLLVYYFFRSEGRSRCGG